MADFGDDDSSNQTPSRQSPTRRNINKSPRPFLAREEAPAGDVGGPSSGMVGGGSRGGDDGGGQPSMAAVGEDHNPIGPPPPPDHHPQQGNPMACIMCGRIFSSDRSLSGHMKVHRDRGWRGSYPPPTFSIQEFYDDENAIPHLNPPSPDEGDGNGGVMDPPPRMEDEEDELSEDENVIPDLNK